MNTTVVVGVISHSQKDFVKSVLWYLRHGFTIRYDPTLDVGYTLAVWKQIPRVSKKEKKTK
jgi:hypothetical protein